MKKSQLKQLIREVIQATQGMPPQFSAGAIMVKRAKENYDHMEALRNEAWDKVVHATRDSDWHEAMGLYRNAKRSADAAYEKWGETEKEYMTHFDGRPY